MCRPGDGFDGGRWCVLGWGGLAMQQVLQLEFDLQVAMEEHAKQNVVMQKQNAVIWKRNQRILELTNSTPSKPTPQVRQAP